MTAPTRPPNRPQTPRPPKPKPPTKGNPDTAIFAAADEIRADLTPARQDPSSAAVGLLAIATPGEPVGPPRGVLGEEPTPGSAVAVAAVACESSGAAGVGVVRAGGPPASGAGTDFRLPPSAGLPRFPIWEPPYPSPPAPPNPDSPPVPRIGVGPLYDALPRRP